MQTSPTISFRGISPNPSMEKNISDRIVRLEQFHPRITSCDVTVDLPHDRHRKGMLYKVSLNLTVPGDKLSVSRGHGDDHAHEDFYVAVRDTFDEAERQLQDLVRKASPHRTRQPGIAIQGRVDRLFPDDGFGFITALDGQDVYFSFDKLPQKVSEQLVVGARVKMTIDETDTGPYAHSISSLDSGSAADL